MKKILVVLLISLAGFGQKNPKVEPVLPDVLMQFPNVRDFTLSPLADEFYFTAQSPLGEFSAILAIKKKNGMWSAPEIASFSGKYKDLEPFFAPDGLKLYFASDRPLADTAETPKDFDIWYVQRSSRNSAWSAPIRIATTVNSEYNEFYPSVAANNNLYFTSDAPGAKGKDDIFLSRWKNGGYTSPVSLSNAINSEGYEFNAYVAPDESFLIFSGYNRKDGLGSGDLYVSYQNTNGTWSNAKNLGEAINSKQMDYCPFVHTATATLYFTSRRSRLNSPSPGFTTIRELLNEINTYENGLSRIYKVTITQLLSSTQRKRP